MSNIVKVVDGWKLDERDGQATVLDVGLAEQAEMKQPRHIRPIIAKAIEDGAIRGGGGDATGNEACFWAETEVIPGFGGKSQEITVYRLNRAAALFIVTRLRTPRAVELTLAIVKVFDQVTSARMPVVAQPSDPRLGEAMAILASVAQTLATLTAGHVALAQSVEQLASGGHNTAAGRAFAATIKAGIGRYARSQCNGTKADLRSWTSKAHNLLRTAMGYPAGPGRSWSVFPTARRQDAVLHLNEMVTTAEKAAGGRAQLTLVANPGGE